MLRAITTNVTDRLIYGTDCPDRHLVIQELRSKALFCRSFQQIGRISSFQHFVSLLISVDNYPTVSQWRTDIRQILQPFLMNQQAIQGIANAYTTSLGVIDNHPTFFPVTILIEIGMTNTRTGLDHWNLRMITHETDQSATTTRDDQVNQTNRLQQLGCRLPIRWQ